MSSPNRRIRASTSASSSSASAAAASLLVASNSSLEIRPESNELEFHLRWPSASAGPRRPRCTILLRHRIDQTANNAATTANKNKDNKIDDDEEKKTSTRTASDGRTNQIVSQDDDADDADDADDEEEDEDTQQPQYYYIAYKIKTTQPGRYRICPAEGILAPRQHVEVDIWMQEKEQQALLSSYSKFHEAALHPSNDKFLIQSFVVSRRDLHRYWLRPIYERCCGFNDDDDDGDNTESDDNNKQNDNPPRRDNDAIAAMWNDVLSPRSSSRQSLSASASSSSGTAFTTSTTAFALTLRQHITRKVIHVHHNVIGGQQQRQQRQQDAGSVGLDERDEYTSSATLMSPTQSGRNSRRVLTSRGVQSPKRQRARQTLGNGNTASVEATTAMLNSSFQKIRYVRATINSNEDENEQQQQQQQAGLTTKREQQVQTKNLYLQQLLQRRPHHPQKPQHPMRKLSRLQLERIKLASRRKSQAIIVVIVTFYAVLFATIMIYFGGPDLFMERLTHHVLVQQQPPETCRNRQDETTSGEEL